MPEEEVNPKFLPQYAWYVPILPKMQEESKLICFLSKIFAKGLYFLVKIRDNFVAVYRTYPPKAG